MNVYLDWNATAPPLPAAWEAMRAAALEAWGNPSSVHAHGRAARMRVEAAREAVARLADADPRDVVLTSGGTEANNLAIRSAFASHGGARGVPGSGGGVLAPGGMLATSRLEHPSVTKVAEALEREGRARVRWLAVLPDGRIDLGDLERAFGEGGVVLVALQSVNAETGVVQPVAEACALAKKHGARVHVDAVQEWGKLELAYEADSRSLAAHKFRGPKGIGALIARPGLPLSPVLRGGSQERGLRPGTVDPIACGGLAAASIYAKEGPARYARVAAHRDTLERELQRLDPDARVNGAGAPRAPHVANLAFGRWKGPELVAALDLEGVSCSAGSACNAGTFEPSAGLSAMLGPDRASHSLRLSLGETTTGEEIARVLESFGRVLARG